MFTPISAVLSLLFFASTLPNGIRLVELPSESDSIEILAGYTSGGLTGFTSTSGATALLSDAYAAGGKIELIAEPGRTALRVTAPRWALPMLAGRVPALFKDVPDENESSTISESPVEEFRAKVEEEIRSALLGASMPIVNYATEEAFVLISSAPPDSLRDALAAIPKRPGRSHPEETIGRLPAERTLRFKSELPAGAVIFASPIPGTYYKQWYLVLLLDRLIRRIVPLPLTTTLPLTVRPYYYRLELAVPAGQFPEPVEENLLQELQRLQFTRANAAELAAAQQEALAYLDSRPAREWFASHDILSRREEGVQWIQSMSADDMRVAARDLLIMNRVVATWAPRPQLTSVSSEPLTGAGSRASSVTSSVRERDEQGRGAGPPGEIPEFPSHTDPGGALPVPERLSSGVSLVAGTGNAVFISGGTITRFDRELTPEDLKPFEQYRAARILVFSPAFSLDRARQLWSSFKGSTSGAAGVSRGKVSGGDLTALFILKTILDLKIIESGWWRDASLRIDAGEGSDLQIDAGEERRRQILDWIKAIADAPLPDTYFAWVREVAVHRFEEVRADLQALLWERDAQGTIQDPATVLPKHVQDVAGIYF